LFWSAVALQTRPSAEGGDRLCLWLDDILNFTTQWYFWVPLLVLLVVLIGVFILLRVMKKDED